MSLLKKAATTTAALALTIACSIACNTGTPPAPDADPDRSDQRILQLQKEIQTLKAENAPTETPKPTATRELPTPTRIAAGEPSKKTTPTSTLPPPPRVRPTDNICRRSPNVQQTLLTRLQISSCRIITNEELFRLNGSLRISLSRAPQPGDLDGLVNLEELVLSLDTTDEHRTTIPAHTFFGIQKLRTLSIYTGNGSTTIAPSTLTGLGNLEELHIHSEGNLTISTGFAAELPKLNTLELQLGENSHIEKHALGGFPKLPALVIYWTEGNSGERKPVRSTMAQFGNLPKLEYLQIKGKGATIQPDTFANLPALESLSISSNRIKLNEESFQNSPRLKKINMYSSLSFSGLRTALRQLERLEELSTSTENQKPEVILSPKSPLMRHILNQERSPDGYTVIPPGGE